MPTSYAKNKIHIYNYVETHREKVYDISKQWRNENRDLNNERRRIAYDFKHSFNIDKEWKRFRNIELF